MAIIQATTLVLRGVFFLAGILLLILLKLQTPNVQPFYNFSLLPTHREIPLRFKIPASKNFLYLLQTEKCLPENFQSPNVLGDPSNHDVIVLSWKEECHENDANLHHVHYIFDNRTSWGSGRNLLYNFSLEMRKKYLYYIFMDDDLEFYFTRDTTDDNRKPLSNTDKSPLQQFELFLLHYQPAIGLTHYCSVCGKDDGNDTWVETTCCSSLPKSRPIPNYVPASITFDGAFNAFHFKAIHNLLPYRLEREPESWWESQKYLIIAADVLYRGHVIKYTPVTVLNFKHRSYPQMWFNSWSEILKNIQYETPKEFRDHFVFKTYPNVDMTPVVKGNIIFTPAWNMTIAKPMQDIVPYAHMKKDLRSV